MQKYNICRFKTNNIYTYITTKTLLVQTLLRFVSFYDLDLIDLKQLYLFRQKNQQAHTQIKIQPASEICLGISNIYQFLTLGKLLPFACLDPSVYQFSHFRRKRTHISTHVLNVLRYALMNAAAMLLKRVPSLGLIIIPR